MTNTLVSTRFGALEISDTNIIEFPDGLIGLEGTRYTLLETTSDSAFRWLHSLDFPDRAIPVTDPWGFFSDFELDVCDADVEKLGIDAETSITVYVTVRASAERGDFSANLAAPILLSGGRGYQIINQLGDAPLRAPLFADAAVVTADAA